MQWWWPNISLPVTLPWHRDRHRELRALLQGRQRWLPALPHCHLSLTRVQEQLWSRRCFLSIHQHLLELLPGGLRETQRAQSLWDPGRGAGVALCTQPGYSRGPRGSRASSLCLPMGTAELAPAPASFSPGARAGAVQLQHLVPMCAPPSLVLCKRGADTRREGHQHRWKHEGKLQRSVSHSAAPLPVIYFGGPNAGRRLMT